MKIGIIGRGAIGNYVSGALLERGHEIVAVLVRPERLPGLATQRGDTAYVSSVEDLPGDIELVVDCAGHEALKAYGPDILRRGIALTTVSIGALADAGVHEALETAAADGNTQLHLASGAIGALDCLQAARVGKLENVTYVGRKPPAGWRGSPAEQRLDLDNLDAAAVHFEGTARVAATEYPKNANVAAAVALAGLGFDATQVRLIADPGVDENIHEIEAVGDFGRFSFEIRGRSLPDNPRSSALAAMSAVAGIERASRRICF